MSTTSVPVPQPTPAPVSSIGRLFGALFDPKATFESIAQRPTWVLPMLLMVILGVVSVACIAQRVGWRQVIEKQIAQNPRAEQQMEQLSPDQREHALDTQTKIAGVFGYGVAVVGTVLGQVIIAALLLAAFNIIAGARMGFSTSLGIVAHSWMPFVIASLLGILILFIKDPSTIDIQNLIASNPGALLAEGSPRWLVVLLSSLDIFTFWALVLQVIGFRATNPKKISLGTAIGCVFGLWLIYVLVKVGFTAALS